MDGVLRRVTLGLLMLGAVVVLLAASAGVARARVDYMSLCFVDRTHGWAAGIDDTDYNTRVWRTTDGGTTWQPVGEAVAAGAGIGWVSFVSRMNGVWGHGSVEHTADGGDHWAAASTVGGIYNQADFASRTRGWAGWSNGTSESGGGIARTDDGGKTWKKQVSKPQPDGSGGFSRVSAPTTKRCYVLKWGRRGGVYATANAGASWTLRALPRFTARYRFYTDIDFPAATTGWAVGDSGRIVKTTNAGASWKKQASGCSARLTAVDFVDGKVGYVVGAGGRVLKTADGGGHWKRLKTGTTKGMMAVCFVDRTHGWVAGSKGVLLRTTNGGKTWTAPDF